VAKKAVIPVPAVPVAPAEKLPDWGPVLKLVDAELEVPAPGASGYAEFELRFENALAHQLGPFIDKLPAANLTEPNIEKIEARARGAYYLILQNKLVYIGKSDAKLGLRARLLRHYSTLKCRKGIAFESMKFKAVKIPSFSAIDCESLLLDLHRQWGELNGVPVRPPWNFSGFGSNDTGRERDTQKVSRFDGLHPLDLSALIELPEAPVAVDASGKSPISLSVYLRWLSGVLPFTFRCQRSAQLSAMSVDYAKLTRSTVLGDLLLAIHAELPATWSITVLRGKVLLYMNDVKAYKSPVWRLDATVTPEAPNYALASEDVQTIDEDPSGNPIPE
jgi:hypothetical protein